MSSRKKLLGLDDPNVITQHDRGASHYIQDHPFPSSSAPGQRDGGRLENAVSKVSDQLYKARVRYPKASHNAYIPNRELREIMSRQNVLSVVMSLPCFGHLPRGAKERVCDRILSKDRPCWRLLAALLLADRADKLAALLEDSVSDQCLPFACEASHCRVGNHSQHRSLEELNEKHRDEVSRWSYAVSAPYFKSSPGQHFHLVLDSDDILPITKIGTIDTSNSPSHQKSGHEVGNAANGGFGEVRKVTIDSSHYSFDSPAPGHPVSEPEQYFALKRLYFPDRENFNRELSSLLSVKGRQDEHLIKLLTTFEVKNEHGSTFYLLFPWAEGDLWLCWKRNDAESKRIPLGPWMAEQCHRIANVLMHFHNEREKLVRGYDDIEPNERELYGRHGDLKADNILWFPGPSRSILVLADFGLGRLHTIISRSKVDPLSIEKTATYRAPEFDLKGRFISRASDIFSLGCMYLEFVTWYLEGWESVSQTFVEARSDIDVHGINSDIFFHIEGFNSDAERAIIKPKVIEWINRLKANPRCSQYILQFLDLIEKDMLEPDSRRRANSSTLVPKLELLSETCRRDSDFWKDAPGVSPLKVDVKLIVAVQTERLFKLARRMVSPRDGAFHWFHRLSAAIASMLQPFLSQI
ncbi:kinase-like domain-containing protein [Podospora appendiculata]|uniref:Kinase-like domain-containing protein n=1 Tax=Podospora appendiculata TaxID=314037 RepID=A0AAE0X3H1_9PEZI|nr:kinase-like domain-containing protein [Podospora appendiculata]